MFFDIFGINHIFLRPFLLYLQYSCLLLKACSSIKSYKCGVRSCPGSQIGRMWAGCRSTFHLYVRLVSTGQGKRPHEPHCFSGQMDLRSDWITMCELLLKWVYIEIILRESGCGLSITVCPRTAGLVISFGLILQNGIKLDRLSSFKFLWFCEPILFLEVCNEFEP